MLRGLTVPLVCKASTAALAWHDCSVASMFSLCHRMDLVPMSSRLHCLAYLCTKLHLSKHARLVSSWRSGSCRRKGHSGYSSKVGMKTGKEFRQILQFQATRSSKEPAFWKLHKKPQLECTLRKTSERAARKHVCT